MLTVTIVLCGWCKSVKPLEVQGAENIPPGVHNASLQVSHGICIPCGTRFSEGISKGGVTHSDTSKDDTATGKEEGGI